MKKSSFFTLSIIGLTLAAFIVRLLYLLNSHPFIDEFTTVLAAKIIWQRGVPILPSGMFYEHGMLFSYLAAPFVGLTDPRFLFSFARLPSLFISTLTVPLLYKVGQRWFSPWVGMVAALLLAFSPEGMVWGGRARMYALAQFLVLLLAFFLYEGSFKSRPKWRWLALFFLLLALVTQFGVLMFVPPLVVGTLGVVYMVSTIQIKELHIKKLLKERLKELPKWAKACLQKPKLLAIAQSPWVWQGIGLGIVLGIGVLVKRLGQPLGMAQLGTETASNPLFELWNTIAYQISLALDIESSIQFLARQFGVPHHMWLTIVAILGLLTFITLHFLPKAETLNLKPETLARRLPHGNLNSNTAYLYLWLVFGLTILEMVTLLEPFRRNPRYIVMGLPLFYLIVGASLFYIKHGINVVIDTWWGRISVKQKGTFWNISLGTIIFGIGGLFLLFQQGQGLWLDLLVAYRTPEPPYDAAFQYVASHQKPDDVVLTMNTSAAALYLEQVDFFAIQDKAEQFLLNANTNPVDRWLGIPWLGTAAEFNQVLNKHSGVWFVVDTQRLTTFGFYRGDWLALLNTQMTQVWSQDNAFVFYTRSDRVAIPTSPEHIIEANFAQKLMLYGYSLLMEDEQSPPQLTLFWRGLSEMDIDYSIFIHLRDENNTIVKQWDRQPLDGAYPTSQWQAEEDLADPISLTLPDALPAGDYTLAIGLYQLDTLERLPLRNDNQGENAVILLLEVK